mmetsp:Transcript_82539/g.145671  ORF Transcript_82539/g.145671 Transcript_82539/m.145671 type:complete len:299 (+) Transcript_82539:83-979(+)|eukprot:CAMPEP_0197664240 /NCGR_PEP_ID=MMETSP1338-20131121/58512_1 /TAXON_ID=43686 ORGANISM="Pelagodinium beii, Strain RCC1491" /NCGR_SAMPLE_ID=MMETSP1338 /ASSEMBLY_ACC=CAM_ASM_000754 /LENGTH=298 /DNA_ID=CAMNT_0043242833 /DNA_START=78 /DNA_END=977 /DNA_ORIENTATION=+
MLMRRLIIVACLLPANAVRQVAEGEKRREEAVTTLSWQHLTPWNFSVRQESLIEEVHDEERFGPNSWKNPKQCDDYRVKFKLSEMHSFFTVPTCGNPNYASVKRGTRGTLSKDCGKCDTSGKAQEIHWNIPGCEEKLCKWPTTTPSEVIGPKDGLAVHPVCAWAFVHELDSVYKYPYRGANFGAVFQALGGHAANPMNWFKVASSGFKDGFHGVATAAARAVDWRGRLNPDCKGARSKDEILKIPGGTVKNGTLHVTPIGAVCWNNVMDFRDLWCHYKKALDVTNSTECQRLSDLQTR